MKIGEKLKQLLGVAAPTIGAALGGPFGGIAGKFVQNALGVTDEQAATAKIESDPTALLQLKQAELDFQKHLADCNITIEQITADDRKDARARQVLTHDNMPAQVFYLTTLGFFGTLLLMFFKGLPDAGAGRDIVLGMVGTLGTVWIASSTYFVGSTRQSASKDATIASIAQMPS